MPSILPGMTVWGACGKRYNYVITQDSADNDRFSVSARNPKTGKKALYEFSIYTSFDDAKAVCNAIELGKH